MKRLLQQVLWFPWTIWCGLTFAIIILLAFPLLVIGVLSRNEKWLRQLHFLPPGIARLLLFLWRIRIEIRSTTEFVPQHAIYISNHTSYLDALVAGALIPSYVKFLGKGEILYWPVLGFLLKHFYVPVWRDDSEHRAWSMDQMREKIKSGASFFICPEGTCNTTSNLLKHFHSGAYRLAIESHIPMVVMTIVGSQKLFPRKGLMIRPGTVVVYIHPPIDTSALNEDDVESLKHQTIEMITADLLKHYPDGVNPV